jgi:hypothetical protein
VADLCIWWFERWITNKKVLVDVTESCAMQSFAKILLTSCCRKQMVDFSPTDDNPYCKVFTAKVVRTCGIISYLSAAETLPSV